MLQEKVRKHNSHVYRCAQQYLATKSFENPSLDHSGLMLHIPLVLASTKKIETPL